MTSIAHLRRLREDQSGLTMIELIVYGVLSVAIGTIVLGVMVASLNSQKDVTAITAATTRGQVAVQTLEKALRNGQDIAIEGGGATIKILTTLTGADKCQAWRVNGGNLEIATNDSFTAWKPFAKGVVAVPSTVYFVRSGLSVQYNLGFSTEGKPVNLTGSVASRTTGGSATLGSACS